MEQQQPGQAAEDWDTWDPMGEDFRSAKNTLALNPDKDPLSIITGQREPESNKVNGMLVCDHFLKRGRCADGKYCDRLHIDRETKQRIEAIESGDARRCITSVFLSPIDYKPDRNCLYLVTVNVIKSPQDFHVVIPYEAQNFFNYDFEALQFYIDNESHSSARRKLGELHAKMAKLLDNPYRLDNVDSEIHLGQIVACKLPNSRYRRAMIIETPDYSIDKFLYKLRLIDYGAEVDLARESIYDIDAEFLSEPPLAIHARLNIKPPNESTWSDQAKDMFITETKATSAPFLLCRILDYALMDEMFIIDLLDMKSRRSLSQKMIDLDLAAKC